jgi:hypothetical protein
VVGQVVEAVAAAVELVRSEAAQGIAEHGGGGVLAFGEAFIVRVRHSGDGLSITHDASSELAGGEATNGVARDFATRIACRKRAPSAFRRTATRAHVR